jgi:hypothetical protein
MLVAGHDQRRPRCNRARQKLVIVWISRDAFRKIRRIDDHRCLRQQRQNRLQWRTDRRIPRRDGCTGFVVFGEDRGRENEFEPIIPPRGQNAARMRPRTPPKKIPDRSTFMSRMTRGGAERDTGAITDYFDRLER